MAYDTQETLFVPKQENLDTTEDDEVSSTSSSEDEVDDEFEVEMVLAERPDPVDPTRSQYLIKWENYPMEQCTWEPLQNLGEGVLQGWEETKAEIKNGTQGAFDLSIYEDALKVAEDLERRRMGIENASDEDSDSDGDGDKEAAKTIRESVSGLVSRPEDRQQESTSTHSHTHGGTSQSIGKQIESAAKSASEKRSSSLTAQTGPQSTARYHGTARAARPQSSGSSTTKPAGNVGRSKLSATSSTVINHQPSSLRNKFQGKKAKRSGVSRAAPRIVMPGEQIHRPRRRLEDTMTDPSKDPKRFHSMRVMNIARKRAIERNDQAPRNVSAIPAHFLMSNHQPIPAAGNADGAGTLASTKGPDMTENKVQSVSKRPRKAVRFTGAADSSSVEDMTVESPQQMMDVDEKPSSSKKLSLSSYQARPRTTTTTKYCSFGPSGSTDIQVNFADVPSSNKSWISAFHNSKAVAFDRECRFDDFALQRAALMAGPSHLGTMQASSTDDDSLLINVAANLSQEGTALQLFQPHYCVLVFPANDSAWLKMLERSPLPDSPPGVLQFFLFEPSFVPQSFPTPRQTALDVQIEPKPDLVRLIKDIFCLDPHILLPRDPKETREQVFMLCFSTENLLLRQAIALWLRTLQPGCRIYNYTCPGAWKSFVRELLTSPGALIFDEIMSPRIRRFPKIWHMVDSAKCCTLWSLASGESINPPRFPSNADALLAPAQYHLTQLFPHGSAFFLTPSFVMSDPKGLCEFLEHFIEWGANLGYLVVASHDFLLWLHDVVNERDRRFHKQSDAAITDLFTDKMRHSSETQKEDLVSTKKAINLWHTIMDKYGDEQTSNDIRKIEWAPRQLNACDEQSLLNWFCWWSLQRLDRHRRFIIIGSNARKGMPCSQEFDIPNYPEDMVADPDVEEAEVESVIAYQRNAQITAWQQLHPGVTTEANTDPVLENSGSGVGFTGSFVRGESIDDISIWLRELDSKLGSNWSKALTRPVAYVDRDMADHFDDSYCAAATFKQWLYAPAPFTKWFNTWMGLFYTIDGLWDRNKPMAAWRQRPWLAVYRPMNPHHTSKPYKAMELFIWDVALSRAAMKKDNLSCLTHMQSRLVDFVRREAPHDEVSEYFLARVWIGNMVASDMDKSLHPLEVTCRHLYTLATEGRIWLPPKDEILEERGWIKLNGIRPDHVSSSSNLSNAEIFRLQFPKAAVDHQRPEQIIFHPMRSQAAERHTYRRTPSNCANDMYRAALEARLRDPDCLTAVLRYQPTLEWYANLKEEKRDASHVQVETWDYISAKLEKKKIAHRAAQKATG